jgi:hypothetical protein
VIEQGLSINKQKSCGLVNHVFFNVVKIHQNVKKRLAKPFIKQNGVKLVMFVPYVLGKS